MTVFGPLAAEKFWILDPLYNSLGTLLAWFYGLVPSYGVAIILLTLTVRIITLPLTAKQARSQQQMQRVAPELKRLQAKYKHDKQKLNEEMMKFYKEHHVNPFGGCLPVLIQAPVLIVLYRLILDLTAKPDLKHIPRSSALFEALKESAGTMVSWGFDLAQTAAEVSGSDKFPYLVLVALVVATGYYQQKQLTARVSRENINPQMAMMTKIFPVMFGFISFTIPAGVVVYFLVSNIWQIGQQAFLFRNQPAAEPDKDEAAKDGGKGAKGGGKAAGGPKGKLAAGPSTKGQGKGTGAKGAKGAKGTGASRPAKAKGGARSGSGKRPAGAGAARGGGTRSPAKGGPPARGGGKGSGKGAPGNRPSGRVTPPKRGQPAGKGKPAVKGAAPRPSGAAGRSADDRAEGAEQPPRWWQRLRPAAPAASPPARSGGDEAVTGPAPKGAGGGGPRPKSKAKAKGTPPKKSRPATGRPGRETDRPARGAPARPPSSGAGAGPATTPPDPTPTDAGAPVGSAGNGQASGASREGEVSPPPVASAPVSNGSGDARADSDNPMPGLPEPVPEARAGDDGEPGTRSSDEAQKGDE